MKNGIIELIGKTQGISIIATPDKDWILCCAKITVSRKEDVQSGSFQQFPLTRYHTFGQMICLLIRDADGDLTLEQLSLGKALDGAGAICEPVASIDDVTYILENLGKYVLYSSSAPEKTHLIS